MVTNINFSSPDGDEKKGLSGKSTLAISITLLSVVLVVQGYLSYEKNTQVKKRNQIEAELMKEKEKINAQNYGEIVDFQERLSLIPGLLDERVDWERYFRSLSKYVAPDIYFQDVGIDGEKVSIKGTASNLDTLSRGIVLLKSFPGAEAVEFRSASEKASTDGRGGVSFEAGFRVNSQDFKNQTD